MKRTIGLVLTLSAALLLFPVVSVTAVGDNGTGVFWLRSGANGTGEGRNFNIGPNHTENLGALRYNSNCSGTCDFITNTVSSVQFSCGSIGTPIDQSDAIDLYDIYPNVGAHVHINPNYPGSCVNGTIIVNLSSLGFDNKASSMITDECDPC